MTPDGVGRIQSQEIPEVLFIRKRRAVESLGELGIVVWGRARWVPPLLGRIAAEAGSRFGTFALVFFDPNEGGTELRAALHRCKLLWIVVRPHVEELHLLQRWWRRFPSGRHVEVIVVDCGWSDVSRIEEAVRQLPRWPRIWIPPMRDESPASTGLSLRLLPPGAPG